MWIPHYFTHKNVLPFKIHSHLDSHTHNRQLKIPFWQRFFEYRFGFQLSCHNRRAPTSIDRESLDDYYDVFTFQLLILTLFKHSRPFNFESMPRIIYCQRPHFSHQMNHVLSIQYLWHTNFIFIFISNTTHTHVFLLSRRSFPASIFQCTVKSWVSA